MAVLTHRCPHCLTEQMGLRVQASSHVDNLDFSIYLACPKCRLPSVATIRWAEPRFEPQTHTLGKDAGSEVTDEGWTLLQLWPAIPPTAAPPNVPPEVARTYLQAERNFSITGNEEASGTMYRKALDLALKRIDPTLTGMLGQKIKKLTGKLTPDIIEWSDHVRALGNDAAHEDDPIPREDLVALRGFTDMVLQYLFTLPGMVKKRRGEKLEWE